LILVICIVIFALSIQSAFAYSIGDLVNYLQNLFYTVTQPVVIGGTVSSSCNQECVNKHYSNGTCRVGNMCYSGETDILQDGCPSNNECCCSGASSTSTTTQQTTTIASQYCDFQPGYRCMPNVCSNYQQPCGSTNVYSCQDKNMKCCFGTCSVSSTSSTTSVSSTTTSTTSTTIFIIPTTTTAAASTTSSSSSTTTKPTTTTVGTTTTISTGILSGEIKFDKEEYDAGETATVSWSWSNARLSYEYSIYGFWEIYNQTKNVAYGYLNSPTGKGETTLFMSTSGRWEAKLHVCSTPSCDILQERNSKLYSDSAVVKIEKCVPVYLSGNDKQRFDIVFLAHEYKDFSKFAQDVSKHKDTLLSIEPFKSYSNAINVWLVNENFDLGCSGEWVVQCNMPKIEDVAHRCPVDQIVVLVEFGGGAAPRIGVPDHYITVNARWYDADKITVHELGHSIAGLKDEYIYDKKLSEEFAKKNPSKGPNCDGSDCDAWKEISGTGCFKGCSYDNWYRSTECSIMKNTWDPNCFYFNGPSIKALQNKLNKYKISAASASSQPTLYQASQISLLNFNYNNGTMALENVSIGEGFASTAVQQDTGYKLNVLSPTDDVMQSYAFELPTEMFYDYAVGGQLAGGVEEQENVNFTVAVPYQANISKINVLAEGKEVLSTGVSNLTEQGRVFMATSEGQKQITITPEIASQKAGITAVKATALKEENTVPVYFINGTKQVKLLFFIPLSMDVQAKINAENGEIISIANPWWSFLAS